MGKRKPTGKTRSSLIIAMLRRIWLWSPERKAALKRDGGACCECGDTTKPHVHHINGINWDKILRVIYKELLCDKRLLVTLCKKCHKKQHGG